MAKSKQQQQKQKKKDRERRVAQKKLAATVKKREAEKTSDEPKKTVPERTKLITGAVPKTGFAGNANTVKKSSFTQRRSGG